MSRIGKKPIPVPEKVEIKYTDRLLTVKGPKGALTQEIHPYVDIDVADNQINVKIITDERHANAYQGLVRSLVNNMVTGVTAGFTRVLEVNGVGYRVETTGKALTLHVGYSSPVNFFLPEGITAEVEKNNIKLSGIDKQKVGQAAASIRKIRPTEPYKGKGIKYVEERIIRKAGKSGGK